MKKFKVVAVEPFWNTFDIERDVAKQIDADTVFIMDRNDPKVMTEIQDCDALVIQYLQINDSLLDKMPKCKIIVRTGIGVNNVDLKACAKRGVMVANIPDYLQGEVADHAMALFLSINRKLLFLNSQVRKGVWNMAEARPIPLLKGQVMGILGCGQIGQMLAQRAQSFGMNTVGYDPFLPAEIFKKVGITQIEKLDDFFKSIDHLSIHIPLTDDTFHTVTYERLAMMKPHSIILNTSRGPILDEAGLYKALKEKKIFGAGLDVQETEPPTQPIPLAEFDSVIFTPHVGYYSTEAEINMKRKSFEEVVRVFKEGQPKHWVNKKFFADQA